MWLNEMSSLSSHDRMQTVMLPQSGYFLSQPGLNIVSALPNGSTGYVQQSSYLSGLPFSLPLTAYTDANLSDVNLTYPSIQSIYTSTNKCGDIIEKDYQIITYEELEKLLPEPKPTGRVELGILPNGCAYAPKTASRENYLLFASKGSYILYFTHHYFSRENLCRDQTFLSMLINRIILPIEKLIKAPRLAALNTTVEEVEQALLSSKIVCVEDIDTVTRGVRRIDGYPGMLTADILVPFRQDNLVQTSMNLAYNTAPATGVIPQLQLLMDQKLRIGRDTSEQSSRIAEIAKDGATVSLANITSPMCLMQNQSVATTVIQSKTGFDHSKGEGTDSNYISVVPLHSQRPDISSWTHQNSPKQVATYTRQSLGNLSHSGNSDTNQVAFPSHSVLAYHSRTNLSPVSPMQSSDVQNLNAMPMRSPTTMPQYLIGQTGHISSPYPAHFPYSQINTVAPHFNLTMVAALASMNTGSPANIHSQHSVSQPPPHYFPGQILNSHPNQINPTIGHQQSSTALATANQYQAAAVAAMAAAAQNTSSYFPNPMGQTVHSHSFPVPAPVNLPLYYAAQQIPLQSPLQRHTFQRIQNNSVYPLQTFNYSSVRNFPGADHGDALGKTEAGSIFSTSGFSHSSNIPYPLIVQSAMQFQQSKPSAALSNLTAAATGLQLHCPQHPRLILNSFGLSPIPVNLKAVNTINDSKSLSTGCATLSYNKPCAPNLPKDLDSDDFASVSSKLVPVCESLTRDAECIAPTYSTLVTSLNDGTCDFISDSTIVNVGFKLDPTTVSASENPHKTTSPASVDGSEDSVSSGIGEMTTTSAGESESRTSSSSTITEPATSSPACNSGTQSNSINRRKEAVSGT